LAIRVHGLHSQGKLNEPTILDTDDVVKDDFRTKILVKAIYMKEYRAVAEDKSLSMIRKNLKLVPRSILSHVHK
jgi:hypothetical protein